MITALGLAPMTLLMSGMGIQAVPMALFIGLTGLATAGGMS